ncbi:hypothetical protein [Sphingobium chlorophenolicum]|uniref:Uncharacterized protein n=1 Tax=Sphingobium chlorophenolicum TaxID=46429 RepID=A0A081RDJ6_SPHCR|nr:hypothetical protein [Sphingobium chlorophenolicum]KEQ53269.1 hypothetical protein BV95_02421 [Sphingobium chlorophenolicum]
MGDDEGKGRRSRRPAKQSDEQLNRLAALDAGNTLAVTPDLSAMADADLIRLRAALDVEMKRRNLAVTVGQIAEQLAIGFFNGTAGRPNLQLAPTGTTNVDALSRRGERYSIKGVLNAKKTGTIYPDSVDREKQLFEFLLVVKVDREWSLEAIYEFDWKTFCECRSWDSRMNAWYLGLAAKTLARATAYRPNGA